MPLLRRHLLALPLLLSPLCAHAWGQLGHKLVGELAERHLSLAAEAQIKLLLSGESDPTLAGIANWADALRNSDPDRFKKTSRWHYVDHQDGTCGYDPARDCADGNCVIAAIETQQRLLADRSQPLTVRRDALKFLVHLVGDVHQPMHASNRDDRGGNDFQISLRTRLEPEAYARANYVDGVMGTNLHAIWDYYLLGDSGSAQPRDFRRYADQLDALPWPRRSPGDIVTGPATWAGESCRLVDTRHLYPDGHRMDRSYLDMERPLAEQRIRQAAYRLAELLDQTLAAPTKR